MPQGSRPAGAGIVDVEVLRRLARTAARALGGIDAEHAPRSRCSRRAAFGVLHRGVETAVSVAVSDRRRRVRRRSGAVDGRADPALPRPYLRCRCAGSPLSRARPRHLLLGARDVLRRDAPHRRALHRPAGRRREAAPLRRTRHVVPHVRDEHAPVSASWDDFERYWDHMCHTVLEDNKATATFSICAAWPSRRSRRGCPNLCGASFGFRSPAVRSG